MARTYAHDGDTIIIERREYRVNMSSGAPTLTPATTACEACGVNDAYYDDPADGSMRDASGARFLCPGCVNRAMEAIVVHDAIAHLTRHDDDLRTTLEIFASCDNYMMQQRIPYVDTRANAHDQFTGDTERVRGDLAGMFDAMINVIAGGTLYGD